MKLFRQRFHAPTPANLHVECCESHVSNRQPAHHPSRSACPRSILLTFTLGGCAYRGAFVWFDFLNPPPLSTPARRTVRACSSTLMQLTRMTAKPTVVPSTPGPRSGMGWQWVSGRCHRVCAKCSCARRASPSPKLREDKRPPLSEHCATSATPLQAIPRL